MDFLDIEASLTSILKNAAERQEVFSKAEAAEFLRVRVPTLERLAFKKNEIAYSKPAKHAVFLKRDLLSFLYRRRIPSIFDEGV